MATKRVPKRDKVPPRANISFPDSLRFGCEFEFYVSGNTHKEIEEELTLISGSDILINLDALPTEKDRHNCLCFKYDSSLGASGVEISVPICSYDTLLYYIVRISSIIDEYGTTNEDTGFHIHISMDDSSPMDFYAFLLLCDNANLLHNWGERNGYSLNPMEILNYLDEKEAKLLKNKKGRIWSIERRGNAHVEIRTMGGAKYHTEIGKIKEELDTFIELFQRVLKDMKNDEAYRMILKEHVVKLKETSRAKTERFHDFVKTINPILG